MVATLLLLPLLTCDPFEHLDLPTTNDAAHADPATTTTTAAQRHNETHTQDKVCECVVDREALTMGVLHCCMPHAHVVVLLLLSSHSLPVVVESCVSRIVGQSKQGKKRLCTALLVLLLVHSDQQLRTGGHLPLLAPSS